MGIGMMARVSPEAGFPSAQVGGSTLIRVYLVEDHAAFRQPLAFMLDREPDLSVVGQAGSLAEARDHLGEVDIVLLDFCLPDGSGIDLVDRIHAVAPRARVLALTATTDKRELAAAIEAGVAGVIHKTAPIAEIVDALRRLARGEDLMPVNEALALMRFATRQREADRDARLAIDSLTPRERDVLRALARGMSDKEIAQQLNVSAETVRSHMVNILGKLDVASRLQALVFSLRHGLVSIDSGTPLGR